MKLKIAIQGIETSFHDVAARKYFGNDIDVVECGSFKTLCDSLLDSTADYAVMAIENTLAGSLLGNYSLLQDHKFSIIGEVFLNIQLHLMVLPGVKMEDLKFIESHPIAIRQCNAFLWDHPNIEVLEKRDTAESAKHISDKRLVKTGAIANEAAAKKFGLEILESRIETDKQNFTRFLVLSKTKNTALDTNKATLFFELGHKAGILADVLNVFKIYNINLTKIQSVPVVGKPYQYAFHIDIEWGDRKSYEKSIIEAQKITNNLNVLGEYKKSDYEYFKGSYDYTRS